MTVGSDMTRISIVMFSNTAEVLFDLDDYFVSVAMVQQLKQLKYEGGNTNTTGTHQGCANLKPDLDSNPFEAFFAGFRFRFRPQKHESGFGSEKKSDGFESRFESRFHLLGTDHEICIVVVINDLDSNHDSDSDQLDLDSS